MEEDEPAKTDESFDAYTVAELIAYAEENSIEITSTSKADIIAEIELSLESDEEE